MVRFIVLTFAFLGWSFYEMSGGADFEPGQINAQREAARLAEEAEKAELAAVARADTTEVALTQVAVRIEPQADETTEVAALGAVSTPLVEAATDAATPDAIGDATVTEAVASSDAVPTVTPAAAPAAESTIVAEAASAADLDLRRVTGNRVNMRQGPGTNYSVVAKLVRNDEVIILQDPGDGWVKLRVVDGNRVGWMADFLLASVE